MELKASAAMLISALTSLGSRDPLNCTRKFRNAGPQPVTPSWSCDLSLLRTPRDRASVR